MMSTSFCASCLRMANISSCLRMVLAFSTSCSSAKPSSSVGDLDLRSWSFISRIRGGPVGEVAPLRKRIDAPRGEKPQVLGVTKRGLRARCAGRSRWTRTRMHPPTFGEMSERYEKTGFRARGPSPAPPWLPPEKIGPSEWLYDGKDHDADHQDGRHFVNHAVITLAVPVLIGRKVAHISRQHAVEARQQQDQHELGLHPPCVDEAVRPDEPYPGCPRYDHRWVDDLREQPMLHHLERLRLLRATLGATVVNEQPRQIKHAGHPRDHRHDVQGQDPRIKSLRDP